MKAYRLNEALQINKITHRVCSLHVSILSHGSSTRSEQPVKKERYAFSTSHNIKSDSCASFCSAKRLLKLYNKHHGKSQQKLTKAIREWFKSTAYQAGWHKNMFLEDVQIGQVTGCMLGTTSQKGARHVQVH